MVEGIGWISGVSFRALVLSRSARLLQERRHHLEGDSYELRHRDGVKHSARHINSKEEEQGGKNG